MHVYDDVPFVFVKTPAYKGNGIKRIYSYFYFSLQIKRLARKYGNPDIVCHNSKIPFDIPVYWFAKKTHAKYIIDVQDLWPRCFELMGFLKHNNPLLKFAYKIEERLYSMLVDADLHGIQSVLSGRAILLAVIDKPSR